MKTIKELNEEYLRTGKEIDVSFTKPKNKCVVNMDGKADKQL